MGCLFAYKMTFILLLVPSKTASVGVLSVGVNPNFSPYYLKSKNELVIKKYLSFFTSFSIVDCIEFTCVEYIFKPLLYKY